MSSICNSLFFCRNRNMTLSSILSRKNMFTDDNKMKEQNIIEEQDIDDILKQQELTKNNEDVLIEKCINEIIPETIIPDKIVAEEIMQETIQQLINNDITNDTIEHINEASVETQPSELITPSQTDTLFWCIYIAVYGYNDYIQIDRNYGVKELEIKKKVAEELQTNPNKLKNTNTKITKIAIQEILSELLTSQKETSIICLIALSVHYNINITLVDPTKSFYLEYIANKDDTETPTYILHKDTFGKYTIKMEPLVGEQLTNFKSNMICLENHTKPLKAISNYKVDELKILCKTVGLFDETKKYKKEELYDLVSEKIRWK